MYQDNLYETGREMLDMDKIKVYDLTTDFRKIDNKYIEFFVHWINKNNYNLNLYKPNNKNKKLKEEIINIIDDNQLCYNSIFLPICNSAKSEIKNSIDLFLDNYNKMKLLKPYDLKAAKLYVDGFIVTFDGVIWRLHDRYTKQIIFSKITSLDTFQKMYVIKNKGEENGNQNNRNHRRTR